MIKVGHFSRGGVSAVHEWMLLPDTGSEHFLLTPDIHTHTHTQIHTYIHTYIHSHIHTYTHTENMYISSSYIQYIHNMIAVGHFSRGGVSAVQLAFAILLRAHSNINGQLLLFDPILTRERT
jgi:hypothetical protein